MRAAPAARLLPAILTGLVLGVMIVTFSISLSTLVYGAHLPQHLDRAIGLALSGSLAVGLMTALLGSRGAIVSHIQDAPAAVLASAISGMAAGLAVSSGLSSTAGAGLQASLPAFMTVAATVAVTTLLAGLVLLLVGVFRLGNLVRFLPYPVVGGFMAGTGWLLFAGGLSVLSGEALGSGFFEGLVAPGALPKILPGVVLAVVLLVLSRTVASFLVWPLVVLGGTGIFYLVAWLSSSTLEQWRSAGYLLGPFPEANLLRGLAPGDLVLVDWQLVIAQAPTILTIAGLTLMAVLLNSSAIELMEESSLDLNRELRATGIGNLLAGALGGQVGYQSASMTALNYRAARGARAPVIVSLLFLAATIVFGASLLEYVPTMLVGGLIACLGLDFLYDWLVSAWRRLTPGEYAVVAIILVVIAFSGFLAGVALGLVLTVGLFVVNYSRIDAVRLELAGADLRSRVRRDQEEEGVIAAAAAGVHVLQLQGYLFFGTTNRVVSRIRRRAAEQPLRTVILDFRRVTGVDASASTALRRLLLTSAPASAADEGERTEPRIPAAVGGALEPGRQPELYLAEVSPAVLAALRRRGLESDLAERATLFPSLDEALEAAEETSLRTAKASAVDLTPEPDSCAQAIEAALGPTVDAEGLEPYLSRLDLGKGERLIRQGDPPDAIYFISSGRLSAWLESEGGQRTRLESMAAGSIVGEVAFYSGKPRSASVVADEAAVLYQLTRETLTRYESEQPQAALALSESLTRRMADRIRHLTATVDALRR